jgi:CBS domain-containing protein
VRLAAVAQQQAAIEELASRDEVLKFLSSGHKDVKEKHKLVEEIMQARAGQGSATGRRVEGGRQAVPPPAVLPRRNGLFTTQRLPSAACMPALQTNLVVTHPEAPLAEVESKLVGIEGLPVVDDQGKVGGCWGGCWGGCYCQWWMTRASWVGAGVGATGSGG